jgi:hypothetical protein
LPLRPALETVFEGLANAHELGSLLQLEEPVEKELRYLQGKQVEATAAQRQGVLGFMEAKATQGALPLGVESYDAWKAKTLAQLRAHFEAEAEAADLTQAFFGQSAGKGLALFDILARRYLIVAANPPYLGSKKLATKLKSTLEYLYPNGRNDLMGMFLERMTQLGHPKAITAFVSNSGFMWLQLHTDLRDYLIRHLPARLVVHLGHYAFEELRDHVDAILWVSDGVPHKGLWIRLVEQLPKDKHLRFAAKPNREYPHYYITPGEFQIVPGEPFLYWMISKLTPLFRSSIQLGQKLPASSGLQTSEIKRFVRSWWEIASFNARWFPYVKGGEATKWLESLTYAVDWDCDGVRIKTEAQRRYGSVTRTVKNQELYFKGGLTFSLSSGKQLAVRKLPKGHIFDVSSPSIICDEEDAAWCTAFLNSKPVGQIVNALNPTMHVTVEDISRIPVTHSLLESSLRLQQHATYAIMAQESLLRFLVTSTKFSAQEFCRVSTHSSLHNWYIDFKTKADKMLTTILEHQTLIDEIVAEALTWKSRENVTETDNVLILSPIEMYQVFLDAVILSLLGHRWPKQIEAGESVPAWAEPGSIIPITGSGLNQSTLYDHVRERLAADFPDGNPAGIEREFAEIVGEKLADWLAGSFFSRHISQFKKRPIAWQLQTSPAPGQRRRGGPAFAALLYYHKLSADLLPTLRSQFVRDLRRAYETEQRTLRQSQSRSSDQEARLRQLESWLLELQTFSDALQQVSECGFGDTPAQQFALRQYALEDAMQSLKAVWLRRLAETIRETALPDWQSRADQSKIHTALGDWIAAAVANLPHHCAQVGPSAPRADKLPNDPDARVLAGIIGSQAQEMVSHALRLAGDGWFSEVNEHVLHPLLDEINSLKARQAALENERDALDPQDGRAHYENERAIKALKAQISQKNKERNAKRKTANEVREHIENWSCPAAAGWTDWLGRQPLFDQFASLDGKRQRPQTIAEFIAQESRYVPDINDGVRVNIAPLQKAGLLAAPVLAAKELDKAIADRADWRADERRWCREGKLPRPGWWV